MAGKNAVVLGVILLFVSQCDCLLDAGMWNFALKTDDSFIVVSKAMYAGANITLQVTCPESSINSVATIDIEYVLRQDKCWEEYLYLQGMEDAYGNETTDVRRQALEHFKTIFDVPKSSFLEGFDFQDADFVRGHANLSCAVGSVLKQPIGFKKGNGTELAEDMLVSLLLRVKVSHDTVEGSAARKIISTPTVTIKMRGEHGFLSAVDWPLLPFYATMCTVYVLFAVAWMTLCFMHWKDILQVQYWIAAVIVIGMTEKAVFYAEYSSVNSTGMSIKGAVVGAEIVSALKRALSRMLVIIVSMGFGIVKPRLGQMMPRVFLAGGLYFILGSIEGCLRGLRPKNDASGDLFLTLVPLALLDSIICWWIFACLVQTLRALKLRRNVAKTSLYRHFANTLAFAVIASVVFMLWSVRYHRMEQCLQSWEGLWLDEAFWHMLFSAVLLVIVVLWRPTKNNRRYAFSPILDRGEDEEDEEGDDEQLLFSAAEERGMRVRRMSSGKQNAGEKLKQKEERKKKELEREWNQPDLSSSFADAAIPALIDSEEELVNTRLELSKVD